MILIARIREALRNVRQLLWPRPVPALEPPRQPSTPEEIEQFIAWMEAGYGRPMTPQERSVAITQAEMMGELWAVPHAVRIHG